MSTSGKSLFVMFLSILAMVGCLIGSLLTFMKSGAFFVFATIIVISFFTLIISIMFYVVERS